MTNIQVSIIIATYNSGKTLQRALDSVVNMTFQNWECIIVDGASTDSTIAIAESYEKKDHRFRHISEPDNGIYDAYNKGWKMAKGEWIHYLGSDDELTLDGMQSLMDKSENADIVYGNTLFRKSGVKKLRIQVSPKPKMGGFCCHQSLIMRRRLIADLRGFDMQYHLLADKDLICRAMANHCRIQQVNAIISIFSLDGASSPSIMRYKESFTINKKFLPLYRALYELTESVFKNTCRGIIYKMVKLIKLSQKKCL